ncbi:cytochrome c biogenesis protein CcdA [Mobiluncus curtisii]|uniref:cytochrome c biogenesis CcdA family protein n=2 Tax=Mobiluncus curtisii TaxID=2051 RepID=UPI0014707F4A|nr:cytochrome c biogenesis CcdA family protein [Mobiluncus curtisii]NMW47724.1 cytochrome c biogenesis protein CcdA [Mobiluncus curtisii]
MDSVTFAVAYAGGILTLFSPCSALLIPSFFSYAFSSKTKLASRTAVFFLGLMAGLLPTGAAFGALGAMLNAKLRGLTVWAGLVIVLFGLWQALALPVPNFGRLRTRWQVWKWQRATRRAQVSSPSPREGHAPVERTAPAAIFLLGLTYGVAATGCQAPILGSILAFSVSGGSPVTGFFTMFAFGVGMFTPVAVLSFLWNLIPNQVLRPRPIKVLGRDSTLGNLVSGLLITLLGLVMALSGPGGLATSLLSASAQSNLEFAVQRTLAGIPNWLFWLLAALLAAFVTVYLWGKRRPYPSDDTAADSAS